MPIVRRRLTELDVPIDPCCDDAMTGYRINDDGTVSQTTDGGESYHDLPEFGNPLNPATLFPPVTGDTTEEIRCKAANSVTGFYMALQAEYEAKLVAEVNALALAAVFQGVLLLIGIGVFTVWAAVGFTVGLLVAKKNAEDFEAEFTDPFWQSLCKHAYCDVDAAGVYINTDPRQIIDEVTADVPGYAASWLNAALGTLNGVALTNMGAAGFDAGIDCSEFECEDSCDLDNWSAYSGTEISRNNSTGHIIVDAVFDSDLYGGWGIVYQSSDNDLCCLIAGTAVTGVITVALGIACGNNAYPAHGFGGSTAGELRSILLASGAPFRVDLAFAP